MSTPRRLAFNMFSAAFTNIVRIGVQIVMLPVMARLLGPAEIGLYALSMPLMTFVLLLADGGLGDSLAREDYENRITWSSAFWALVGSGIVMCLVVYAASYLVSVTANQPRLPGIMLPLSITLLMVAATVIPKARQLRSGNTANGSMAELFATVASAGIAILLAINGFGVWALVGQFVSNYFIRMVLLNLMTPFVPALEFSLGALFAHAGVGGGIMGSRLIELAGRMFENSRVSAELGSAALGGYGYANQIGRFFSESISNPMWGNLYYVTIMKSDEEIKSYYLSGIRFFAVFMFPASALLAQCMPTIVPLLFGAQWNPSIHAMMLLIATSSFSAVGAYHGAIMYARGRVRIMTLSTIAFAVLRIVAVVTCYRFGLTGLGIGLAVVNLLFFAYAILVVSPWIDISRRDLFSVLRGPTIAMCAGAAVMYYLPVPHPSLLWLATSLLLAGVIYIITLIIIDLSRVKGDLKSVQRLIRKEH